jgi:multiple sugar transport system substrate-binding protein
MQRESGKPGNLFGKGPENYVSVLCRLFPICLLVISGCQREQTISTDKSQAKPFQGLTLKVVCPNPASELVFARYAPLWEQKSGAHVAHILYDSNLPPEKVPTADLWVIDSATLPSLFVNERLTPLPATLTEAENPYAWNELLPLYRMKLLRWNGIPIGLPLLDEPWLCYFRTDLLADPTHQAAFKKRFGRELAAPGTWEEFCAIAEYFDKQTRPGISQPCSSLPPLPSNLDGLDHEFYLVAAPFARRGSHEDDAAPAPDSEVYSFHYDLESMHPRIDSPGFRHALALLKQMQTYRPAQPVAEPPLSFERGEAVLCLAGPEWSARFQKNPRLKGKFGVRRAPGSEKSFAYQSGLPAAVPGQNFIPYQGAAATVMAVPREGAYAEAAFDLAAFLSDSKHSRDLVIDPSFGGGVFRDEHLREKAGWQSFGLNEAWTGSLIQSIRDTVAYPQIKNPLLRLRIPGEFDHRHALDNEIRGCLFEGKDPQRALTDAAAHWRQLDASKDVSARRRDYRQSAGLSPGD